MRLITRDYGTLEYRAMVSETRLAAQKLLL